MIDDKLNKEDIVFEERRFSIGTSPDSLVQETRQYATINIELMYKFLSQSPKEQLKYLSVSIKRYVDKNKGKPEKLEIAENYLKTELARLFNEARKSGKPLTQELGLTRYGTDVTKPGNKLNRLLILANKEIENKGYMSKNSQTRINDQFTELTKAFRDRLFSGVELPDEDETEVEMATMKYSNTEELLEDKSYEFYDMTEETKKEVIDFFSDKVSLDRCKFTVRGDTLMVTVSKVTVQEDEMIKGLVDQFGVKPEAKAFSSVLVRAVNLMELPEDDLQFVTSYNINPGRVTGNYSKYKKYVLTHGVLEDKTSGTEWYSLPTSEILIGLNKDSVIIDSDKVNELTKIMQ